MPFSNNFGSAEYHIHSFSKNFSKFRKKIFERKIINLYEIQFIGTSELESKFSIILCQTRNFCILVSKMSFFRCKNFKKRIFGKIGILLFKILNSQLRVVLKAFALGPLLMDEVAGSHCGILSKNINSKHSTHF